MPTRPGSAGGWQPLDTVSSTGPCDVRAIMNERPQPLDEARAHKNIAKMMGTELGIATAHPFQLGAVLALAYNTVALCSAFSSLGYRVDSIQVKKVAWVSTLST